MIIVPDSSPSDPIVISDDESQIQQEPKRRRLIKKKNLPCVDITAGVSKNVIDLELSSDSPKKTHSDEESEESLGTSYNLLLAFVNSCSDEQFIEVVFLSQATKAVQSLILSQRPFESMNTCLEALQTYIPKSKTIQSIQQNYRDITHTYSTVDSIIMKCEMHGALVIQELIRLGFNVNAGDISQIGFKSVDDIGFKQPKLISESKFKLKNYQLAGIAWMYSLYTHHLGGILADEMGLGKTAQIISLIAAVNENPKSNHHRHLIIVPASLLDNWSREFSTWCPSLVVEAYRGTQEERMMHRASLSHPHSHFDVLITTYNIATSAKDDRQFLKKLRFNGIFLDEGHLVKNSNSARFKALMALKADFRLIITGTPLQNDLKELVSVLSFVLPEFFLSTALTAFFSISSQDSLLQSDRLSRARKMMSLYILRRSKQMVLSDLPGKTNHILWCEMAPGQRALYESIFEDAKGTDNDGMMMTVMMQLRKCANHPLLLRVHYQDDAISKIARQLKKETQYKEVPLADVIEDLDASSDFELHLKCMAYPRLQLYALSDEIILNAGKFKTLTPLLREHVIKGNKILIFSQFVIQLNILEIYLDLLGISFTRLDGTTNVAERQDLIDEFNEDDTSVFLLTTKAGGVGLNLASANVVILYDMDFNPHNDLQAENRAHRVGQSKEVIVYRIVCKGSVEERILELGGVKLALDEKLKGGVDGDEEAHIDHSCLKFVLNN